MQAEVSTCLWKAPAKSLASRAAHSSFRDAFTLGDRSSLFKRQRSCPNRLRQDTRQHCISSGKCSQFEPALEAKCKQPRSQKQASFKL